MLVLTCALSSLSLTWAGQTSSTDRALFFAEGFEDTRLTSREWYDGDCDGVPHDQTLWIDELAVGTRRIGR